MAIWSAIFAPSRLFFDYGYDSQHTGVKTLPLNGANAAHHLSKLLLMRARH